MSIVDSNNEYPTTSSKSRIDVPLPVSQLLPYNSSNNKKMQNQHSCYQYTPSYSNNNKSNMYYMLSIIIWFILCVGVVMKHNSLIDIFYSFVACTTTAMIVVKSSSLFVPPTHVTKVRMMMLIGTSIGIMTCTLQAMLIAIACTNDVDDQRDSVPALPLMSSIIPTYSIAAGYLVFDQWYTFYMIHWLTLNRRCLEKRKDDSVSDTSATIISFYSQPWSKTQCFSARQEQHQHLYYKSLLSVLEDAVTLIVILIVLVQHQQQRSSTGSDAGNSYHRRGSWIAYVFVLLWPLYKLSRMSYVTIFQLIPAKANDTPLVESYKHNNANPSTTKNLPGDGCNKVVSDKSNNQNRKCRNSPPTMIWRIYGNDYDLTNFVHEHPGGYEAIMLGCNRDDCTALFRSYHPSPSSYRHATKVLRSYRVHPNIIDGRNDKLSSFPRSLPTTTKTNASTTWNNTDPNGHCEVDEFYDLLCERVTKVLSDRHQYSIVKDRTATPSRVAYYLFVTIGVLVSAYNYGIRGSSILFGSIPFAIFGWLFGALGHDAGHYAVCRTYPIVNDICVWAMCLLCNPIVWQHQHTYGHHSHTNDFSRDPDLHHFTTLLRVHEKFQYCGIYRNQRHPLYVFFAYTFVVFGTCIWIPWGMIQEGSLYGIVEWTDRQRPLRTIGMYAHLLAYVSFIVVVPFFVYTHWYMAWFAVATHISLSGTIFAIFSQINHLNELSLQRSDNETCKHQTANPTYDENADERKTEKLKESWSVQQIKASNNFCPQSIFWHYVSNGLNLQIEHHLFPGINHCHLPKIQPIVKDMCIEHGIPYKCYDSWYDIMNATLEWLDQLSESSPGKSLRQTCK